MIRPVFIFFKTENESMMTVGYLIFNSELINDIATIMIQGFVRIFLNEMVDLSFDTK